MANNSLARCVLLLVVGHLFASGCYYRLQGRFDPFRCEPACTGGAVCIEGNCVSMDAGAVDRASGVDVIDGPPPDAGADVAGPDTHLTDSAPDQTSDAPLTDGAPDQTSDTPLTDGAPDQSPLCSPACSGSTPVCCQKTGPTSKCYTDSSGCVCSAASNPCTGATPYCCDKNDGNGLRCHTSPGNCLCSPTQSVCAGSIYPVCCEKWDGLMRCYLSADECKCSTTYNPCTSPYDTCCDQGSGTRCYLDPGGCI